MKPEIFINSGPAQTCPSRFFLPWGAKVPDAAPAGFKIQVDHKIRWDTRKILGESLENINDAQLSSRAGIVDHLCPVFFQMLVMKLCCLLKMARQRTHLITVSITVSVLWNV